MLSKVGSFQVHKFRNPYRNDNVSTSAVEYDMNIQSHNEYAIHYKMEWRGCESNPKVYNISGHMFSCQRMVSIRS